MRELYSVVANLIFFIFLMDTTEDTTTTVAPVASDATAAQAPTVVSTVFVGGLAWATDEASLRAHFENAGLKIAEDEVITDERGERTRKAVTVARDKFDGRAKGYGFVNLTSPEEAQKAIELLHETELDGRTIRVQLKESKPREDRPRREFGGNRGGNNFNRGGDRGNFGGGNFRRRDDFNSDRGSRDF